MTKFNKPVSNKLTSIPNAVNASGGAVFEMSERQKLINYALNANFQNTFYTKGDAVLAEIQSVIRNTKDPLFMAKLAVWARHEHGARAVSHVIAAELAKRVKNAEWMKNFINAVIYRPDDALEILGYYLNNFGKPIPNSFKRGVSNALAGFDEYQFAKYKKSNSAVSLKDLVLLCHPQPSTKNHVAIEKLLNGTLKQVNTAQAKLSEAGKKETVKEVKVARKEALNELINEKKLGYSALIVNFVDILNEASDDEFEKACEYMVNENAIKNSLMYPIKYYILYEVIRTGGHIGRKAQRVTKALEAINKAMQISFKPVPKFEGKRILVAQDISGSMDSNTESIQHGNGKNAVSVRVRASQYASMFALAMLKSGNNVDYCRFESDAEYASINTADSFMTLINVMSQTEGGTNMESVFELIERKRQAYDMIFIISDNESYSHASSLERRLQKYRISAKRNTILVTWDLTAKATNPFNDRNAVYLCGFSAKVFETLGTAINEEVKIEKQIEAIDFRRYIDRTIPWTGGRTLAPNAPKRSANAPKKARVKSVLSVLKVVHDGVPKTSTKKAYVRAKKSLQ